MSFIARVLRQETNRIGVVEAGTGTGKTIAYCIPAIQEARRVNKKVVIVTSTVVLQRQLLGGELQQLADIFSPSIRFGIVKGRGRYACLHKISKQERASSNQTVDLFGEELPSVADRRAASKLSNLFYSQGWDGDMDELDVSLNHRQTAAFTTDSKGCHRQTCEFAKECPYYRVRDQISEFDVVVTNYHLLLAAGLAGVELLPEPSECIYIFDEVHKLPEIVMGTTSRRVNTPGLMNLVDASETFINRLISSVQPDHPLDQVQHDLLEQVSKARPNIDMLAEQLSALAIAGDGIDQADSKNRFVMGMVADSLRRILEALGISFSGMYAALDQIRGKLLKAAQDKETWLSPKILEAARMKAGQLQGETETATALFEAWNMSGQEAAARWFEAVPDGWELQNAPVEVGKILNDFMWSKAYGLICTSASIYSSNGFDHFKQTTGLLNPEPHVLRIDSPFDFRNQVEFQIIDLGFKNPNDDGFDSEAAKLIPRLLKNNQSGLVIFTSWRALEATYAQLPESFSSDCLKQGDYSTQQTLVKHRAAIDEGQRSFIFGLDSYREGVDLPGDYCQHVIIMKIPFPVPSDPVLKTKKETLGLGGGSDGWRQYDLPEAAMKLFQGCGRLMRNETDSGTISVLDSRLHTKSYAKALQTPLPDFDMKFYQLRDQTQVSH